MSTVDHLYEHKEQFSQLAQRFSISELATPYGVCWGGYLLQLTPWQRVAAPASHWRYLLKKMTSQCHSETVVPLSHLNMDLFLIKMGDTSFCTYCLWSCPRLAVSCVMKVYPRCAQDPDTLSKVCQLLQNPRTLLLFLSLRFSAVEMPSWTIALSTQISVSVLELLSPALAC